MEISRIQIPAAAANGLRAVVFVVVVVIVANVLCWLVWANANVQYRRFGASDTMMILFMVFN